VKIVRIAVIIVTVVVTVFATRYVTARRQAVKEAVVHDRRKRRQAHVVLRGEISSSTDTLVGTMYPPAYAGVPLHAPKPRSY
jgi:uncharacterized membrane protein YqiK